MADTNGDYAALLDGVFVVEAHGVQDIRGRNAQELCDFQLRLVRNVPVRVLDVMQDGHQCA